MEMLKEAGINTIRRLLETPRCTIHSVLMVVEGEAGRLFGTGWYDVRTIEKSDRVMMTFEG